MTNLEKALITAIISQSKAIDELQDNICRVLGVNVGGEKLVMFDIIDGLTEDIRKYAWAQGVETIIDTNDFCNALYDGDVDTILNVLEEMEKENGGILPC